MKKNLLKLAVLLPLVGASTLTSCGGSGLTVGVTYYNLGDSNMSGSWKPMYQHLATQYGWEYKDVDGAASNDKIAQGVDSLIGQGAAGLIVNLNQPTQAEDIVSKAKAEDIPIVIYNKEPADNDGKTQPEIVDGYDKAFFVGTTAADAGVMQGKMAFDYLKATPEWDIANKDGKISVFIIHGEKGHAEADARTEWCVKELKRLLNEPGHGIKHNGVEITGDAVLEPVVKTAVNNSGASWDTGKAAEFVTTDIVTDKLNYDMVFSNNDDMAVAALGASQWPDNLPVWGVDCSPSGVESIKSSEAKRLRGSVYNDNVTQPRVAAFLLDQLLQGKTREEAVTACKEKFGASVVYEETGHAFRIQYKPILKENIDEVVTAAGWISANPEGK